MNAKFRLDPSGRIKDRNGETVLLKDVLASRDDLLVALMDVVNAKPEDMEAALEQAFAAVERAR